MEDKVFSHSACQNPETMPFLASCFMCRRQRRFGPRVDHVLVRWIFFAVKLPYFNQMTSTTEVKASEGPAC